MGAQLKRDVRVLDNTRTRVSWMSVGEQEVPVPPRFFLADGIIQINRHFHHENY